MRANKFILLAAAMMLSASTRMPIDRTTAVMWWHHFGDVLLKLEVRYNERGLEHRTPANPRHTADVLKGEAMLCAGKVDPICARFAHLRTWPNDLSAEHFWDIQHRLNCAMLALRFMVMEPDHETSILLQKCVPDPRDEQRFVEWLLVPVWRLLSDICLDTYADQLTELLSPEQLKALVAENPPLSG